MEEREQRWGEVKAEIRCPLVKKPESCRINEGITQDEIWISRTAIIFTAECNFCGEKASNWGS